MGLTVGLPVVRGLRPCTAMVCHSLRLSAAAAQLGGAHQTTVKLVDFGTAKDVSPTRLATWKHHDRSRPELNCKALVGTLKYVAPEVLKAGEEDMYDGRKADVWALGVVLFAMVCAHYPYEVGGALGGVGGPGAKADTHSRAIRCELLHEIEVGGAVQDLVARTKPTASTQLRSLLARMLEVEPSRRATMEQVLRDEWLRLPCDEALASLNQKPTVWGEAEAERLIASIGFDSCNESGVAAVAGGGRLRSATDVVTQVVMRATPPVSELVSEADGDAEAEAAEEGEAEGEAEGEEEGEEEGEADNWDISALANLRRRFPSRSLAQVKAALQQTDGHAGMAAKLLK
eukprot:SAG11_NODE_295_length_11115_cov_14.005264_6_plen_345_part_00